MEDNSLGATHGGTMRRYRVNSSGEGPRPFMNLDLPPKRDILSEEWLRKALWVLLAVLLLVVGMVLIARYLEGSRPNVNPQEAAPAPVPAVPQAEATPAKSSLPVAQSPAGRRANGSPAVKPPPTSAVPPSMAVPQTNVFVRTKVVNRYIDQPVTNFVMRQRDVVVEYEVTNYVIRPHVVVVEYPVTNTVVQPYEVVVECPVTNTVVQPHEVVVECPVTNVVVQPHEVVVEYPVTNMVVQPYEVVVACPVTNRIIRIHDQEADVQFVRQPPRQQAVAQTVEPPQEPVPPSPSRPIELSRSIEPSPPTEPSRPVETSPEVRVAKRPEASIWAAPTLDRPLRSMTPYRVNYGDTVGGLARQYGFRVQDFRICNPSVDLNHIYDGQTVMLPGDYDVDQ